MFQNPIKEVIDLSHEVSENMENISGWTTAFPMMDTIAKTRQLSGGKVGYAARMILISEHTGTHIDAPRHFLEDGMDVASIPVEELCLPGHLLADDQPAHRGGQHRVEGQRAQLLFEQRAEPLHRRHVLADLRALEEMPAVQAGAQDKVPLQQRLGAHENVGDLLLNRVHAKKLWQSSMACKLFLSSFSP